MSAQFQRGGSHPLSSNEEAHVRSVPTRRLTSAQFQRGGSHPLSSSEEAHVRSVPARRLTSAQFNNLLNTMTGAGTAAVLITLIQMAFCLPRPPKHRREAQRQNLDIQDQGPG